MEAAPAQPGYAPPPGYPPSPYAPPPGYPVPGYPPRPGRSYPAPSAQEDDPGAESHDGFYLRMQLGLGYTSMSASKNGTNASVAGGGTSFAIALGGAINPHVIIYGTVTNSTASKPDGKISGPSPDYNNKGRAFGLVGVGGYGNAGVVGLGGGMAYYLDSNLFFAGSLLGSRLFIDNDSGNTLARTAWGFTFEGLAGKEWWVSDNWGLGVSGQVLLGAMKDEGIAGEDVATWTVAAFSVLFSATYN